MNKHIYFYKENDILGKVVKVNNIDEMTDRLKGFLNECKCKEVVYNWPKDGSCGMGIEIGDDANTEYESDMEKMANKISDRVNEFGWCSFEGNFGDFNRICIR